LSNNAINVDVMISLAHHKPQAHHDIPRAGQNHKFIRIYGVRTVLLAGKSPYIRSHTVRIYGSGQP
jgi:hypothetical protein